MATHLDLEEQEKLDAVKAFWHQYGNLITWLLVIVLGAYAAWNGWNWYHRDQATKAGAMYDELDAAATAGDADRANRVFADLKDRYGRTAFAEQGGLVAARVLAEKGQGEAARAALAWVADNAVEEEYRTIARLRLAGLLLDAKNYPEALKQLEAAKSASFAALVDDRRGDVLMAEGKKDEARAAWLRAWKAMDPKLDYRHLVEAKLNMLGTDPTASPASGASR